MNLNDLAARCIRANSEQKCVVLGADELEPLIKAAQAAHSIIERESALRRVNGAAESVARFLTKPAKIEGIQP